MSLVKKPSAIKDNCDRLAKKVEEKQKLVEIATLIKRGRCFIKYVYNGNNYFFPSKFVGYSGNNIENYNKEKRNLDGRHTNKAIRKVLKKEFKPNAELEKEYKQFCDSFKNYGIEIITTSTKRKYIEL